MGWAIQRPDGTYRSFFRKDQPSPADLQVGETIIECDVSPGVGLPVNLQYIVLRRAEYPSLADQLDALWHGMDAGVIPKVPDFYDPIKAIKEKYPKPA